MVRYLSAEWLAAFDAAGSSEAVRRAAGATALTLKQVVTGTPEGTISYTVRVGDGALAVTAGDAGAPDATITIDYPTSVAVASGRSTLHDALLAGRVKIKGDPACLLRASGALSGVAAALADLRAATEYPIPVEP